MPTINLMFHIFDLSCLKYKLVVGYFTSREWSIYFILSTFTPIHFTIFFKRFTKVVTFWIYTQNPSSVFMR